LPNCRRLRTRRHWLKPCVRTWKCEPRNSPRSLEFFDHIITRFDGQRITRLEMVQFAKEHELTHRAQMFMYLRLKNLVPATTRRRLAKQQRA
jgi:hypothetical protein